VETQRRFSALGAFFLPMGRGERKPRRRSAGGVAAAASAASTAGATGGGGVPKKKKKKAKTSTDSEGPQAPVFSKPAVAYVANMVGRLMRLELEMGGEQTTLTWPAGAGTVTVCAPAQQLPATSIDHNWTRAWSRTS
jgi:hypothetical protein